MKNLILLIFVIATLSGCSPEKSYIEIHSEALVADMHSDTILRMLRGANISVKDSTGHMDIPRLIEGGVDLQVFACFLSTDTPKDECRPITDEMIDSLESLVDNNTDKITICRNVKEVDRTVSDGKIAAFIGIENGVAINDSISNLRHYFSRGVRYMTLTHTSSSDWCISSADTAPAFDGLADFGIEVVREMNRLGMIIDISHAAPSTVAKVLRNSSDPIIASHSCVYALCEHDRNLTDEQILAIAKNGGVIGINFFNGYLDPRAGEISDSIFKIYQNEVDSLKDLYKEDRKSRYKAMEHIFNEVDLAMDSAGIDVGTVVDHIDYIVKLVGVDYVGLGSDYDGVPWVPAGLKDCSDVPNITCELMVRGYSDNDIKKILGGNFMRVFSQVCD